MRFFTLKDIFRHSKSSQKPRQNRRELSIRPALEVLEDRSVPATVDFGSISGTAFVDRDSSGTFDSGETALSGVTVTLTGTTTAGIAINKTVATDTNGNYTFSDVLAGTYQLATGAVSGSAGGAPSFGAASAPAGTDLISGINLGAGQVLNQNLGFLGLAPSLISLSLFQSTTTSADFPDINMTPGAGTIQVSPPGSLGTTTPVITNPLSDINVAQNASSTMLDLAGNFTDPGITNSTVAFNTNQGSFDVTLFDTTAPQTVDNFYDYVNDGDYNNAVFTRLVSGFVLQGGGATLQTGANGSTLDPVPDLGQVPNEFGASNTDGTLALAQSAGNPNSGTNQFFFNVGNNSTTLDPQKFTVFGQVATPTDQTTLNQLAATPTQNESNTAIASQLPTVDLQNVPLNNYSGTNFPTDTTASNYIVINSISVVSRPQFLTYSVVSNTNPGLVTTTLTNEKLSLAYTPNMTGTATITVAATNAAGATTDASFSVTVS
jgi:cyclophilin family peptidyl-prolyl cis-trans isomerase